MDNTDFVHPYDTVLSSSLRFFSELVAWIAGSIAVAKFYGWLWVPFLLVLVALPSVFSTIGDKRNVIVPTPGFLRVLIEMLLYTVAIISPWFLWPTTICILCTLIAIVSLVIGAPRLIWLVKGAKIVY